MPDLYDTVKLDDLDKEDIDFQLFLQRLINGEGMLSVDIRKNRKENIWERESEGEGKGVEKSKEKKTLFRSYFSSNK